MGPIPDSDIPLLQVCLGITPDGLGRLSSGELGQLFALSRNQVGRQCSESGSPLTGDTH